MFEVECKTRGWKRALEIEVESMIYSRFQDVQAEDLKGPNRVKSGDVEKKLRITVQEILPTIDEKETRAENPRL